MAKLDIHGKTVAEYVRRSTNPGGSCEVTYRLMTDGMLMKRTIWTRTVNLGQPNNSGWKSAKVKPEIRANPDLLLIRGFQKNE
jgi:hypothetical protein